MPPGSLVIGSFFRLVRIGYGLNDDNFALP